MKKETVPSAISRQYARAYEQQYGTKELHTALPAYSDIASGYPDTKEAGYSRSQIQNIVRAVAPGEILYEAQLNLALKYSGNNDAPDTGAVEATPSVSHPSD